MNRLIFTALLIFFASNAAPQSDSDNQLSSEESEESKESEESDIRVPVLKLDTLKSTVPKLNLDPHIGGNQTITCEQECVPFYLCKNGSVNTNGEGIVNIREKPSNLPCGDIFQVCCRLEDKSLEPLITIPPSPKPRGCGYRHPNGVGFKITGNKDNEAQFAEFPWVVAIIPDVGTAESNPRPKCGGALIHPQAVITAAHCVSSRTDKYIVRAGEWDINRNIEPFPHQDVPVQNVTLHSQFKSGSLYNDIAFIYLKSPVQIRENVDLICLPSHDHQQDGNTGKCISTGWGKDRFGREEVYHDIMKSTDLPLVPRDTCQSTLRNTRLGKHFELHNSFICAGGEEGKDACVGDGGSPLMCPIEGQAGRYYQAGIVAWGIGCGDKDIPGVYVNVASVRNWIDDQMRFHGLDTSGYQATPGFDERGSFP